MTQSSKLSETLERSTGLNHEDRLADVVNGRLSLHEVSMAEWAHLTCLQMFNDGTAQFDVTLSYGGGLYKFHHCIEQINLPAETGTLKGMQ